MPGLLSLPVVCAAIVCGAVEAGTDMDLAVSLEAPASQSIAQEAASSGTAEGPSGVTLVEFDGGWEFLKISRRLRVWRPSVGFTMTVNADGQATGCSLDNAFRKKYVNLKLCEVLMDHHTFKPARDAQDLPVESVYHSSISYDELRAKFE